MKDGYYRITQKDGTSYNVVEVRDDTVDDSSSIFTDSPVKDYLDKGYTFTRVYPIHLPEEMWEEVYTEARGMRLSEDEVIENAVRNFFAHFRPAPEYRKVVQNED